MNNKPIHLDIFNYTKATLEAKPQEFLQIIKQCPSYVFEADFAVLAVDRKLGILVGAVIVNNRGESAHIEYVEVAEKYRDRRVASALIEYILRHAKGFTSISAEVDGYGASHKLIASHGFRRVPRARTKTKYTGDLPLYSRDVDESATYALDEQLLEHVVLKKKAQLNIGEVKIKADVLQK